jgi:hypothetical protein
MDFPSLSNGCEIAQFFVRHTDLGHESFGKLLRKRVPDGLFGPPKSSFGGHKCVSVQITR